MLIVLLLSSVTTMYSQSLRFKRYDTEEGVLGSNVRAVIQDRQGFIWIGTDNGLYQYDAYTFHGFFYDPANRTSGLSDNNIISLYEDNRGLIWIGTNNGGLNCYDPVKQEFQSWTAENSQLPDNTIYSIDGDQEGGLWLGTKKGGLVHFSPVTQAFKVWNEDNAGKGVIPNNYVWKVLQGPDRLWVATQKQLVSLGEDSIFTAHPCPFTKELGISDFTLQEEALWITAWGQGLFHFDTEKREYIQRYRLGKAGDQQELSAIEASADGKHLWIATYGAGIIRWNPQTPDQTAYQLYIEDNRSVLPHNTYWTILEDRAGDLWGGTFSGLIFGSLRADKGFQILSDKTESAIKLPSPLVWSTATTPDGSLWAGTANGLLRFSDQEQKGQLFTASEGLINNRIKALIADSQGFLWIGYWGGWIGKYKYDPEEGLMPIRHWNAKNSAIKTAFVLSLDTDPATGNIWVGTLKGAYCLQPERDIITHYSSKDQVLKDDYIYAVEVSSKGDVWLGTAQGLHRRVAGEEEWRVYDTQNSSLSHNKINDIKEDSLGNIWIATDGGGACYYQPSENHWTRYLTNQGLASNSVKSVAIGRGNKVHFGTARGISILNTQKQEFNTYRAEDGLLAGGFSAGASTIANNGLLMLGGLSGLTYFHPDSLKYNKAIPEVHITGVKVFGQPRRGEKAIRYTDNLILSEQENVLEIDFTALNYLNSNSNQFAYMMEGIDKDWVKVDSRRRFAVYTSLPMGKLLTFRVKGANNDEIWNEEGDTLEIYIDPPFWETLWFQLGSVVIVLLLAWLGYRWRISRVEADKRRLEKQVKMRTQEAQIKNLELEQQNVELRQQQEEILSQRDYIEQKNRQLKQQQEDLTRTYKNISTLTWIGQEVTSHLQLEDLVRTLYERVNQLMDAEGFGIGVWNEQEGVVEFKGYMEHGEMLPEHHSPYDPKRDLSSWCLKNQKTVFINDLETQYGDYLEEEMIELEGSFPKSLIYVPLSLKDSKFGVATVQSFQQNTYTENDLTLLNNLSSYLVIALNNIANYDEIEEAHNMIKQKNMAVMDSLRYAETIQRSVLPLPQKLSHYFTEYFVIYRPKDVVSGDFYWFAEVGEYAFWAVADCTGHGVPGAFMSLIGHDSLNRLVHNDGLTSPAEILEGLHTLVYDILQQEQKLNSDGMDIGLCCLKKDDTGTDVIFAGAKRGMIWTEKGELREVRGTSRSIGGMGHEKVGVMPFQECKIRLGKEECIYLFSDGFVDQNNARRRKLGTPRLRKALREISILPMTAQQEQVQQVLEQHQGDELQRDDITFAGIKI